MRTRPRTTPKGPRLAENGTLGPLLVAALRASGGTGAHADAARRVVLTIVLAQLLAASAFGEAEAPPVAGGGPGRAPRRESPRRTRLPQHGSLAGRRPRG